MLSNVVRRTVVLGKPKGLRKVEEVFKDCVKGSSVESEEDIWGSYRGKFRVVN